MNNPTFCIDGADLLGRVITDGVTSGSINDTSGTGFYNTYLGCNRAGSNAPGIGINSGNVATVGSERFTLNDQWEDAREPQYSALIGHSGWIDRSGGWSTSSGGTQFSAASRGATSGEQDINFVRFTGVSYPSTPGTADTNDETHFIAATQQAAPGAVADVASGAVNDTDVTVEIGDVAWYRVPNA